MDQEYKKYKLLLDSVNHSVNQQFENQKDYIKCQIGCSICCQGGYYPTTRAEAKLMQEGIKNLPNALREKIQMKAEHLRKEKEAFVALGNDILTFKYTCPMLIDDKCSIYEYRPMMCRLQGLIQTSLTGSLNLPACVYKGYNYANIWDEHKECFSEEKITELGLKTNPQALGFSYEYLAAVLGYNPDKLLDNIANTENDEIKMIFEWVTAENLNKY